MSVNKFATLKNKETGEVIAEMIGPPNALTSGDALSEGLYALSETIIRGLQPDRDGGGLGGRFGYGVNFENDVFMMHPFCWCEGEKCLWCAGCKCESAGEVEYFLDGIKIKDWSAANEQIVAPMPHDIAEHDTPEYEAASRIFDASIAERNRRLKTFYPAVTHHCEPRGLMENRDRGESYLPNQSAPHFWHKRSGLKVWWYKWIGRDMEISNPKLTSAEWHKIMLECFESLPEEARTKAIEESEADAKREADPEYQREQQEHFDAMMRAMGEIHHKCQTEGHDDPNGHCSRCGLVTDFEKGFMSQNQNGTTT